MGSLEARPFAASLAWEAENHRRAHDTNGEHRRTAQSSSNRAVRNNRPDTPLSHAAQDPASPPPVSSVNVLLATYANIQLQTSLGYRHTTHVINDSMEELASQEEVLNGAHGWHRREGSACQQEEPAPDTQLSPRGWPDGSLKLPSSRCKSRIPSGKPPTVPPGRRGIPVWSWRPGPLCSLYPGQSIHCIRQHCDLGQPKH